MNIIKNDNEIGKNTINFKLINNPEKKIRNPNIDFIRTIGMFAIVIHHIIIHGNVIKKYGSNELRLLNILLMWHVSSFGIVSGLVGNYTYKFSKLLYLWILVVFYGFIIYIIYNKISAPFFKERLLYYLFPIVNSRYWYWTSYFGMYPFLPFINGNLSKISQIQFKKCMYFMIGIFIIWTSYYQDPFFQMDGHSVFTLLTLYIYGCYINKYIFNRKNIFIYRILICVLCSIIFIFASLMCYYIYIKDYFPKLDYKTKQIFKNKKNSFCMLLQVFSIIIFVAQINFNKAISKIFNFLGPLTFDVYIIHENTYIHNNYIKTSFNEYPNDLRLTKVFILIFIKATILFSICIFIAYIRNILFRILKIKSLCSYFEIIITKILNYFL